MKCPKKQIDVKHKLDKSSFRKIYERLKQKEEQFMKSVNNETLTKVKADRIRKNKIERANFKTKRKEDTLMKPAHGNSKEHT